MVSLQPLDGAPVELTADEVRSLRLQLRYPAALGRARPRVVFTDPDTGWRCCVDGVWQPGGRENRAQSGFVFRARMRARGGANRHRRHCTGLISVPSCHGSAGVSRSGVVVCVQRAIAVAGVSRGWPSFAPHHHAPRAHGGTACAGRATWLGCRFRDLARERAPATDTLSAMVAQPQSTRLPTPLAPSLSTSRDRSSHAVQAGAARRGRAG